MSALTPICVKCRLEMRCVKNNRLVRDPDTGGFRSTFWMGDEYECPECKARIVTGFGKPFPAEHDPTEMRARERVYGAALQFDYERPREEEAHDGK